MGVTCPCYTPARGCHLRILGAGRHPRARHRGGDSAGGEQVALGRLRDYLMAEDVDREYYINSDSSAEALSGVGLPRKAVDGEVVIRVADARFSWPKVREPEGRWCCDTGERVMLWRDAACRVGKAKGV